MKQSLKKKLKNKKGFTLAELLVAVAIIVILLGLTMMGVVSYAKNMRLTEMDSTARQVFIAAQNHLTSAKVTGRINNASDYGQLMTIKPSDFDASSEDKQWPGASNDEYYYLVYSPKSPDALTSSMLKNMLPFGAIDQTVRTEGSYIIEYNVKTATVYGVFYTDNAAGVTALDVAQLNQNSGRDPKLGRAARRDHINADNKKVTIGYYGGAMADELDPSLKDQPTLLIENGERLLLKISDTNFFKPISGTVQNTSVQVVITGEESGASKKQVLDLELNGNTFTPQPKVKEDWWKVEKVTVEGIDNPVLEYEVCLDDITCDDGHFASMFPDLIPGENIKVEVIIDGEYTDAIKLEGSTNSLFYSGTNTTNNLNVEKSVEISAIRHLENLDPMVSKINANIEPNKPYVKTAKQTADLDWNVFHNTAAEKKSIYSADSTKLTTESYYGVHLTTLEEYNGNGKTLRNFVINNSASDTENMAAVFQSVGSTKYPTTEYTIENLTLEKFDVMVQHVSGSTSSTAKLSAGSLVAVVNGSLKVNSVAALDGEVVSKDYHAGGLIGEIRSGDVEIRDCASAMKVEGRDVAGGLIGSISGENNVVSIITSYSSGRTDDGIYKTYNVTAGKIAGGLIGHVGSSGASHPVLTVDNCYSTASPSAPDQKAGGFVGEDVAGKSTYKDCYATGLVDGKSRYFGGTGLEGGFACEIRSPKSITGCRYLNGINGNMPGLAVGTHAGVIKINYDDLSVTKTNSEPRPYDLFLIGKQYPFPMVNATGKTLETTTGVHFGDWPDSANVEETHPPMDNMFAYYVPKGDGATEDRWFIKGVTVEDQGELLVVHNDFYPGIENSGDPAHKDREYGLFLTTKKWSSNIFKGSGKEFFKEQYSKTVIMDGVTYYFYPILDSLYSNTMFTFRLKNMKVVIRPGLAASIEKAN